MAQSRPPGRFTRSTATLISVDYFDARLRLESPNFNDCVSVADKCNFRYVYSLAPVSSARYICRVLNLLYAIGYVLHINQWDEALLWRQSAPVTTVAHSQCVNTFVASGLTFEGLSLQTTLYLFLLFVIVQKRLSFDNVGRGITYETISAVLHICDAGPSWEIVASHTCDVGSERVEAEAQFTRSNIPRI